MRIAIAALTSALAALPAQDSTQCRTCTNTGRAECKQHGKGMVEKEAAVKFCSAAIECKGCSGALYVDCRSCLNPKVETAMKERQKLAAEWLAARRKAVDDVTKNVPLMHLETAHFDLVFSLKGLMVGKARYETHALMHLYGERLESLRTLFMQVMAIDASQQPGRFRVFMFRDQQDQSIIGPRVTGIGSGSSTTVKLMGDATKGESVYSMCHDLEALADDEALHRNIVHCVTHMLLANMLPMVWIGNRKHGWVDEGLANWFEDKVTGKCSNYCYEEVSLQPGFMFKGGRWRPAVRQMVDAGKGRSFAELSGMNTDQLDFEDHAMAFAYVDFLIVTRGGDKFRDLAKKLKEGVVTREALQAVYKLDSISIDDAFRAWVKATYPLQAPKGK